MQMGELQQIFIICDCCAVEMWRLDVCLTLIHLSIRRGDAAVHRYGSEPAG